MIAACFWLDPSFRNRENATANAHVGAPGTRITEAARASESSSRVSRTKRRRSEVGLFDGFEAADAPCGSGAGWPPERAARAPVTFANLRRRPAPLDSDMGLAVGQLRAIFQTTDVSEVGLFEAVDAPRGSGVAT